MSAPGLDDLPTGEQPHLPERFQIHVPPISPEETEKIVNRVMAGAKARASLDRANPEPVGRTLARGGYIHTPKVADPQRDRAHRHVEEVRVIRAVEVDYDQDYVETVDAAGVVHTTHGDGPTEVTITIRGWM